MLFQGIKQLQVAELQSLDQIFSADTIPSCQLQFPQLFFFFFFFYLGREREKEKK